MKDTRKVKIIGAGGIGSYLIEPLARYLNFTNDNCEVTIMDGDKYEEKNRQRQKFVECENKADQTVSMMKEQFPNVHFRAKSEFVTEKNIITSIREEDVVFLCVDNHATRKLVSDRCEKLKNVTLISGGNDYTDGNVIIYSKKNGKTLGKPPTKLDAKIANPEDKNPGDIEVDRAGCQQETESSPQLLFTNLAIASTMLNCYYAHEQDKINFDQVYVDIVSQRSRPSPEKY